MENNKEKTEPDVSTEDKIKGAARIVFYKKGFAATRTRDIAEEAGINLALLNYYFRSKAKLFEIIMIETLSGFMKSMVILLNDPKTDLDEKTGSIVSKYIDLITKEPEIPTFIVTEIRSNPGLLLEKLPIKQIIQHSVFIKQYKEAVEKGDITEPNPLHFLINLIGLIVFPFIAKPLIIGGIEMKAQEFDNLIQERKKLIPVWIKAMMSAR